MSYDINIVDKDGNVLQSDNVHHIRGGTYCVGGTTYLSLNITYNYSAFFRATIDEEQGIRWLYGKTVLETIPKLLVAIEQLMEADKDFGYDEDEKIPAFVADDGTVIIPEREVPKRDDYWAPTPKNAANALQQLVALGALAPMGVWDGD